MAARQLPGEVERRLIGYVRSHRVAHGTGPTWKECATALGEAPADTARAIRRLSRKGWLACSHEPRSLDVGPTYAAALGALPPSRAGERA